MAFQALLGMRQLWKLISFRRAFDPLENFAIIHFLADILKMFYLLGLEVPLFIEKLE